MVVSFATCTLGTLVILANLPDVSFFGVIFRVDATAGLLSASALDKRVGYLFRASRLTLC